MACVSMVGSPSSLMSNEAKPLETERPTPEDAQAFYDAAVFRFEYQEKNRGRFAARVRQLFVLLIGIGAGGTYFMDILLAQDGGPQWLRTVEWVVVVVLGVLVLVSLVFVVLLFWSAKYAGLPSKMVYDQAWKSSDHLYGKINAEGGGHVERKTFLLREVANLLLLAADENSKTDKRRQSYLDWSKKFTAASGVVFTIGLVLSFLIRLWVTT